MDYLKLLAFSDTGWGDELLRGFGITVGLALATLPFGLIFGFAIALLKLSRYGPLRIAGNLYTTIFRGLPELLTLFIVYYGGQMVLQRVVSLFSDRYVEVNSFVAGMIALGAVFSAFAGEVFASAFKGIDKGQYEASHALGLSRWYTMRKVIFPQLMRLALPGLSNLWMELQKGTSLVSVIALNDLMRQTSVAVGFTKQPLFFFSVACLMYLSLSIVSSFGIIALEKWTRRGEVVQ